MIYRLPPLNALRVFEAAARHQSFTQAAAELGTKPLNVARLVARRHLAALRGETQA